MTLDLLVESMETFTLVGVLVSAAIFMRLAIKAKSIGNLRFQLSLFILIWAAAEVPQILETLGLIVAGSLDEIGLVIHLTSMAIFAVFVGFRSYKFLSFEPPHQPLGTAKQAL